MNYVLTGFIQKWWINLPIAIVSMIATILIIRKMYGDKELPAD